METSQSNLTPPSPLSTSDKKKGSKRNQFMGISEMLSVSSKLSVSDGVMPQSIYITGVLQGCNVYWTSKIGTAV